MSAGERGAGSAAEFKAWRRSGRCSTSSSSGGPSATFRWLDLETGVCTSGATRLSAASASLTGGTWQDYRLRCRGGHRCRIDCVVVLVRERGRGRGSGAPFDRRWAQVWTFSRRPDPCGSFSQTRPGHSKPWGCRSKTLTPTPEPAGYCAGDVAGERGAGWVGSWMRSARRDVSRLVDLFPIRRSSGTRSLQRWHSAREAGITAMTASGST